MSQLLSFLLKFLKSGKNAPLDAGTCYTHVKTMKINYTWTISNFSLCDDIIESSPFSVDENDETKWILILNPCFGPNFEISLKLLSTDQSLVKAIWKFFIITDDNEKFHIKSQEILHKFYKTGENTNDTGPVALVASEFFYSEKLVPNDKLTLFCEIIVVTDIVNMSGEKNKAHMTVPACQIADDFRHFRKSKTLADITFDIDGKILHAHKAILAARSLVFSAMFQNEMTEQLNNHVLITDIEYEVFDGLLHYIYTGEVRNLHNYADGMVMAADKYDLQRLKIMSAAILCKTLTVDNVSKRLMLSDLYRIPRLKTLAMDFINMHTSEVTKTPSFEILALSHPLLIADTLRASAENKKFAISETHRRKRVMNLIRNGLQISNNFPELKAIVSILWAGGLIFHLIRR